MKERLNRLLENRNFYMVVSVLLAIFYWLALSLSDDSAIDKVIYDVPVQLDYNASTYQNFGLDIIGEQEMFVDVTVSGSRSTINDLDANDFLVYPDVNSVTNGGIKVLRLVGNTVNPTAPYSISKLSRDTVTLRFDKIISKKFPVQLDTTSLTVDSDYLMTKCYSSPAEITITGPSEEVGQIDRVVADLPGMAGVGALRETKLTNGVIRLLDKENQELDRSLLTLDSDKVEVTIPILRRMQIALRVEFINVPQGFSVDTLGCRLDHETINVAVPTEFNESLDSIVIGTIDFAAEDFDVRQMRTFELKLGDNYQSLDNISTVTASFNTEGYVSKMVTVSDIRVVNEPDGVTMTPLTRKIYNVELYGPAEAMASLDALEKENKLQDYIVAQIDGSRLDMSRGAQTVNVQILLPSINNVLAVGNYRAVINVE